MGSAKGLGFDEIVVLILPQVPSPRGMIITVATVDERQP
jgi:hypothetical protein